MKKDSIILIAEHDEEHFDMMKSSLLRAGVANQILRLVDGRQTLDYLLKIGQQSASEHTSQRYVLFMDVNLPDVGGVEDNGIGIAPEHIKKIFEIFYQLEPQKRQGEGIGLAIVRRIINRHNGKVWAESKVGAGSKFFVAVPGV
jgi:light-regulated signal transduction histidine kinase (bacteriophytochrome)